MEYLVIILGLIGVGMMIWRREWMLYILAVSLPFERIPSFELSGITIRVSNILILGAVVIWLVDIIKKKKVGWQRSDWLLIGFLMVGLIDLNGAMDVGRGVMVLGFTLYVFLVYWLVRDIIQNPKSKVQNYNLESLAKVIVGVGVVVSILGIFQFLGDIAGLSRHITGLLPRYQKAILGFPRIQSVGLEPLYLANFLFIPLGLMIAGKLTGKKWFRGLYDDIFLVIMASVFVLTVSRGAYLGMLGLLIVGILLFWKNLNKDKVGRLITDVAGALLIVFLLVYLAGIMTGGRKHGGSVAIGKFTGHAADRADFSSADRITTAKVGLQAWRSSPVIGIGLGQFGPYIAKERIKVSNRQIVNNEPIELLSETGILGLLAILGFLGLLFIGIIRTWRQWDEVNKVITGGLMIALIGILIQYQFFSTLYIVWVWFVIGMVAGIIKNEKMG